ncbi:putative RNA-directed DNA polymerase, eukaryota, reverse transcriptase zinc-binding domain protein [Tanacetum coccineum]
MLGLFEKINEITFQTTLRGRSLVSSAVYYEVAPQSGIPLRCCIFGGVTDAKLEEERFLKQKAKIEWLEVRDSNSAFFHKSIKSQNQRSRIDSIRDAADCEVTGSLVVECFVNHYQQFLGTNMECVDLDSDGLFLNHVSAATSLNMVQNVSNEEVKIAMFSIGDDRASGPDGFMSAFFKKSWDLIGNDVCSAAKEFFNNGQLLKEINHTFLALIPKVATPLKVNDYRPISCCNVIYKCISKILTNRIIDGLKEVVSDNQSAFIPGRRITNNILITQEVMHNYHRDRGPPRCAFKVDIQKAYDMVDWKFLSNILILFGFHKKMVKWIMACVSSASFSLCINGDIHGYFNGKRGLRQGDPISPYLFTLVMEVLTLIIKRRVRLSDTFRYHNKCDELELINVCFADDLFIFIRGDVHSARPIMEALD